MSAVRVASRAFASSHAERPAPTGRSAHSRLLLTHRILAGVLALSLLSGALRPARAAGGAPTEGGSGTPESKVGVLMAVMCGFALKMVLPAPVPWAGVAAAACTFAFLDAAMSPDDAAPAQDPPPKP